MAVAPQAGWVAEAELGRQGSLADGGTITELWDAKQIIQESCDNADPFFKVAISFCILPTMNEGSCCSTRFFFNVTLI